MLRHERDHLEASVRRQTGEDLPSGATAAELRSLEHKLECALGKVRETKVCVLLQHPALHNIHLSSHATLSTG